nr:9603_t:CDS:2 [Entrophospora candida]
MKEIYLGFEANTFDNIRINCRTSFVVNDYSCKGLLNVIAFGPMNYFIRYQHWYIRIFDACVVVTTFLLDMLLRVKGMDIAEFWFCLGYGKLQSR